MRFMLRRFLAPFELSGALSPAECIQQSSVDFCSNLGAKKLAHRNDPLRRARFSVSDSTSPLSEGAGFEQLRSFVPDVPRLDRK